MEKISIQVEVAKETHELGKGLVAMLAAVLEANKDGWQMGQDLPQVAMVAFQQMAAVEGIDKIKGEMEEDPAAFGKALALSISDAYGAVKAAEVEQEGAE